MGGLQGTGPIHYTDVGGWRRHGTAWVETQAWFESFRLFGAIDNEGISKEKT